MHIPPPVLFSRRRACRVVDVTFEVDAPVDIAWELLGAIEQWPTWAAHIRSVEHAPGGPLGPASSGRFRLRGGLVSTFEMTAFAPPAHWRWHGPFLWLDVDYDHAFAPLPGGRTQLRWTVDVSGPGAASLGRVFGAVYRRNLAAAVPAFVDHVAAQVATTRQPGAPLGTDMGSHMGTHAG